MLQGFDSCKLQISVDVGSYRKQSDGGIFTNSLLYHHLEHKLSTFFSRCGVSAKKYLMRPYSGQNLTPDQEFINNRLSRARRLVKCAFGIINSKWRILRSKIKIDPDNGISLSNLFVLFHTMIINLEGSPDDVQFSQIFGQNQNRRMEHGCSTELLIELTKFKTNLYNIHNRMYLFMRWTYSKPVLINNNKVKNYLLHSSSPLFPSTGFYSNLGCCVAYVLVP